VWGVQPPHARCTSRGRVSASNDKFTNGKSALLALLNGRLDLAQAESVMQLVGAKTVPAVGSPAVGQL
jgi:tRNA U34 5-carboxymethylaminomethyl modifying GTPase MnmE/TrmE